MKKELKFPSIIGVVVLLIAVISGVYLTQSSTSVSTRASGSCSPENLQITNVTHNAANISFTTASACLASVVVNNQTYVDSRSSASRIHYFDIKNLNELTEVSFSIISNSQTITKTSYHFKTASTPSSSIPTSNLAWGKVFNPDQKTPAIGIVYLNIPGAAPLSSVVSSNGNWSVSLANSFNDLKNNWFIPPTISSSEDIIVISDDGVTTQVTNTTANNNPVPDIIIGKNSLDAPVNTPIPQVGQINEVSPVLTQKTIDIFNPKDGDILSATKPDFFGSAPLNSSVTVEIVDDTTAKGQVISDNSGSWHWSPPSGLSPGQHTISAKVQKITGSWDTVTRSFIVLAAVSSSPQYVASASATLAPTATITPTPSPVPTTRVAKPSVTVKPPVSGNVAPTMLIITTALIFFFLSVKFIK